MFAFCFLVCLFILVVTDEWDYSLVHFHSLYYESPGILFDVFAMNIFVDWIHIFLDYPTLCNGCDFCI